MAGHSHWAGIKHKKAREDSEGPAPVGCQVVSEEGFETPKTRTNP